MDRHDSMTETSRSEMLNTAIQKVIGKHKHIGQREIIKELKKEKQWSHATIHSSIKKLQKDELILYRKGPGRKYQYYMPYHQEPIRDENLANLVSKLRNTIDMIDNDNENIAENMKEEMYIRIKNATNVLNNLINRSKLEQNKHKESDEEDYLIKEITKYSKYNIPEIKIPMSKAKEIYSKIHTLRKQYTSIARKSKIDTEKINPIASNIRENMNKLQDLKENIPRIKHMYQEQIFRQEINKMQKPTATLQLLKRLNMAAKKDGMIRNELGRVCEHLEKEIKPVLKNKLAEKLVKTKKFTRDDLDDIISYYEKERIIYRKKNKIYVLGYA